VRPINSSAVSGSPSAEASAAARGESAPEVFRDLREPGGSPSVCETVQADLSRAFAANSASPLFAGVGVDLANIARIRQAVERDDGAGEAFIRKVYRPGEIEYCQAAHFPFERYAALWAVREAAVKALGTGYADGVGFHDLEISCQEGRAPRLRFHGRFAEIAAGRGIHDSRVTLSHDRDYVVAVVVLLAKEAADFSAAQK
jgi:holo-[acyl-carrier protein] synthase